jgi:hypothetical protein
MLLLLLGKFSSHCCAHRSQDHVECIKLARFNAQHHDGVNRKNFAQEWLYLCREAGTALAFSNTIVDIRQRARGLKDPS